MLKLKGNKQIKYIKKKKKSKQKKTNEVLIV